MMAEQLELLPGYLTAHLQLTLVALVIGLIISVPLGIWVTRRSSLEPGVLGLASIIQTVPSLALLAFMVPALAWVGSFASSALGIEVRSIGFLPAIIALTLYSILPILRNTVTGIAGVDHALVEAARGVGMTPRQRLLRVEVPLALPTVVAGLRTATVWVVGTATLSTPVGAPSLGNFIFSGLQTRNFRAVVVGCVAAAVLALVLDTLVRLLETGLRRRKRSLVATTLAIHLGLLAYVGTTLIAGRGGESPVRIGAKTFTEQYILSELLAQQIERETGLPTRAVQSLGSTVAFDAVRSGQIDLYVDYTGTLWTTVMQRESIGVDRGEVLDGVRDYLAREHGIGVAAALGFENAYAIAMRADRARALGIESISDLARAASGLEMGSDYEFFSRPEWSALRDVYGLRFEHLRSMDPSLMYEAIAAEEVDVISAFSTDGRIAAYDLLLLEDDRAVIPPYDAVILVGRKLREQRPAAVAALARLAGSIDRSTMQRMNLAVDREGRSPSEVARELLDRLAGRGPAPPVGR